MTDGEHILIGCVGHPFLRDTSVGPTLVPALKDMDWPDGVEIYDIHFGPIHAVQWLEETPGYFNRVVFLSAVKRDREPGSVCLYRWDHALPDATEIHERVCEAVTGIIGLENLLIIGGHFRVWPAEVAVVEVEPCDEEFGAELSEPVQAAVPFLLDAVRKLALEPLDGLSANPFDVWFKADVAGYCTVGSGAIDDKVEAQR